ncbi:MAG: PbpA [Desulfobacterales bacterium]|nr:PbpA [Desulfobacterales bacterium]
MNVFKNRKSDTNSTWRDYQATLKRSPIKKKAPKKFLFYVSAVTILVFIVYGIITGIDKFFEHYVQASPSSQNEKVKPSDQYLDKLAVQKLMDGNNLFNLEQTSFDIVSDDNHYWIKTSLDASLQKYMSSKLQLSTSRYIGIVIMEADTGRVLSMVGYDKTDPTNNTCTNSRFPAASIFKIITAAAAVEHCNFNPDSMLSFNGSKYTLYKSQLTDKKNKYTNSIKFKDSFAQSVNPVFGKIGSLYLGKPVLEKYASAFGFNRDFDFEIPLTTSLTTIKDDSYHWAEIASGFNRDTMITPVYGAMIPATIINNGKIIEPTIIDRISAPDGRILYQNNTVSHHQAITADTSMIINKLMERTIKSGTGRKAFRGCGTDKTLAKLNIGGKTGSINNRTNDVKFDWFVGFASEKNGSEKITVSVVVGHEAYIGTRATEYARMAIKYYFNNYFSQNTAKQQKTGKS